MSSALGGPRQYKQTKLSFGSFAAASQRPGGRAKKQRTSPTEDQDNPAATTSKRTKTETGPETEQSPHPSPLSTEKQQVNLDNDNNSIQLSSSSSSSSSSSLSTTTPITPQAPPSSTSPQNPSAAGAGTGTARRGRIRITDKPGDLFDAPARALLVHACNAVGSWGGGVALAFRGRYPGAFGAYRAHCARSTPDRLAGTALLIPPQRQTGQRRRRRQQQQQHYIGCLFTSRRYGRARDPPDAILRATGPAMRHLMRLVAEEEARSGVGIAEVRMCRVNSGLFAVPWESSRRAIEELELDEGELPGLAGDDGVVEVVAYEREEGKGAAG